MKANTITPLYMLQRSKHLNFWQNKQTGKMPFIKYVIFTQFEFVLCNSHESPNTLKIKY